MTITLQTVGRRVYLIGNTYPVKDQIKSGGGKWDADRKAWYVGVQRKALAEELAGKAINGLASQAQVERENGISTSARIIKGRAQYEGRAYYVLAVGHTAEGKRYVKLAFRDGSRVFWARNPEAVTVRTTYETPTSIDSLRAYAEHRRAEDAGEAECPVCARYCTCGTRVFCSHHHDGCDRCGAER